MESKILSRMKNIVIVGVGGTGSYLLPVLMRYLNSREDVNREISISIVDGDKYDEGNVGRQEFLHSRIGLMKADVQTTTYGKRFPALKIVSFPNYLGEKNVEDIIPEGSVIFSCVDNHTCRRIISCRCQKMKDVLFISGGNNELDGNVQSFFVQDGTKKNDPIEVRHPEIYTTKDGDRSEMSCEELAHIPGGGQIIFTNNMSACLMLNLFLAYEIGTPNIENVNDIFFDVGVVKTARIVNGIPE